MGIVSGGGGGGTSAVQLATVTVSHAQLLTLDSVAVEIVPSPGAGKAVFVLQVWSALHFVTAAYTGASTLTVAPTYRGHTNFQAGAADALNFAFDAQTWWAQGNSYQASALEYDHTDLAAGAWTVTADAAIATGGGSLTIFAPYVQFSV